MRPWSLVLTAILTAGCAGAPAGGAAHPGAADFRAVHVAGLDGTSVPLSAVLGRRPTLVSFWAPWCEPCLREQPELERLSRAVAACGGSVVGIAVGESAATVSAFARQRGITFAEFTDEGFQLADALGQRRIPATLVFDGAAQVVFTGAALDENAVAALKAVLPPAFGGAQCPPPRP